MPPKSKSAKKQEASSRGAISKDINADKVTPRPLPKWPPMAPLIPTEDLSMVTLLENQILTIPRFWTSTLCKTYVSFLSTLPFSTTPAKPKRGEAVRVNDRFQVDDPEFAEQLWSRTALKQIVEHPVIDGKELSSSERDELFDGEVLGLNSNIRIYRYSKGQFFDRHYDESNNVMFPSPSVSNTIPAKTTWTLLLYLSSPATGCEGGETVFYPDPPSKREDTPPPVVAGPEVGKVLLHRHGNDCLLHEGREVTEGQKWVIRSDLCVKR